LTQAQEVLEVPQVQFEQQVQQIHPDNTEPISSTEHIKGNTSGSVLFDIECVDSIVDHRLEPVSEYDVIETPLVSRTISNRNPALCTLISEDSFELLAKQNDLKNTNIDTNVTDYSTNNLELKTSAYSPSKTQSDSNINYDTMVTHNSRVLTAEGRSPKKHVKARTLESTSVNLDYDESGYATLEDVCAQQVAKASQVNECQQQNDLNYLVDCDIPLSEIYLIEIAKLEEVEAQISYISVADVIEQYPLFVTIPQASVTVSQARVTIPQAIDSVTIPQANETIPKASASILQASVTIFKVPVTIPHTSETIPQAYVSILHPTASGNDFRGTTPLVMKDDLENSRLTTTNHIDARNNESNSTLHELPPENLVAKELEEIEKSISLVLVNESSLPTQQVDLNIYIEHNQVAISASKGLSTNVTLPQLQDCNEISSHTSLVQAADCSTQVVTDDVEPLSITLTRIVLKAEGSCSQPELKCTPSTRSSANSGGRFKRNCKGTPQHDIWTGWDDDDVELLDQGDHVISICDEPTHMSWQEVMLEAQILGIQLYCGTQGPIVAAPAATVVTSPVKSDSFERRSVNSG